MLSRCKLDRMWLACLLVCFLLHFSIAGTIQKWNLLKQLRQRTTTFKTRTFTSNELDNSFEVRLLPLENSNALELKNLPYQEYGLADKNLSSSSSVTRPESPRKARFQLLRQRMWTKMDFLHVHAISGTVFSVFGAIWVMHYLVNSYQGGDFQVAPDSISLLLLGVGALNCFSCLPMTSNPNQAGGFKYLGVGMTLNAIWQSWWVSGYYPPIFSVLDPWIAGIFLTTIGFGIWDSEFALKREVATLKNRKSLFSDEKVGEIVLNHRAASYPNLLHLPVLYNILFGGQAWLQRVQEKWPLEPSMLYHACFAIAVANSIIFLCATLKDRKLMSLRQWLYIQLIMIAPVVTTMTDFLNCPDKISIDPTQVYAGFI